MKKQIIVLASLLISFTAQGTEIISSPGSVTIGSDITYTASANDEVIVHITSSNVSLDLNGHVVSLLSTDTHTGIDAIKVDPGLTNIEIKNGFIQNVSGIGITVGDGCADVHITDVVIKYAKETGVLFDGSTTGVHYSSVTNSVVGATVGVTGTPAVGIRLKSCGNVLIENCKLLKNGSATITDTYGVSAESCTNCHVKGAYIRGNIAATNVVGIRFANGSGNRVSDCSSQGNSSASVAVGFVFEGTETKSLLEGSEARLNDGGAGVGYGIHLSGSSACEVINNVMVGNSGATGYGLLDTTDNTTNIIANNYAFNNTTSGYSVTRSDAGSFPVVIATAGNFTGVANSSKFFNIDVK